MVVNTVTKLFWNDAIGYVSAVSKNVKNNKGKFNLSLFDLSCIWIYIQKLDVAILRKVVHISLSRWNKSIEENF